MKPYGDRCFVKPEPMKEKVGGIYIPEESQEKAYLGTVTAVGHGWSLPGIKVGMKVFTSKRSGSELKVNGEKLNIYNSYDILAYLKEGKKKCQKTK